VVRAELRKLAGDQGILVAVLGKNPGVRVA